MAGIGVSVIHVDQAKLTDLVCAQFVVSAQQRRRLENKDRPRHTTVADVVADEHLFAQRYEATMVAVFGEASILFIQGVSVTRMSISCWKILVVLLIIQIGDSPSVFPAIRDMRARLALRNRDTSTLMGIVLEVGNHRITPRDIGGHANLPISSKIKTGNHRMGREYALSSSKHTDCIVGNDNLVTAAVCWRI